MGKISIGVDADNGDVLKGKKPVQRIVPAVVKLSKKMPEIEFVLAGNESDICKYSLTENIRVLNATAIDSDPHSRRPAKDSSLRVLAEELAHERISGIYSIGSTAKICAVAQFNVGRFPELENGMIPGLLAHIPSKQGIMAVMDLGASTEQNVSNSYAHAIIAASYMAHFIGNKHPRLGIHSNGTEKYKGNIFEKSLDEKLGSSKKLSELFHYVGKIDRIFEGEADIIITDGSSGNKDLKIIEGTADFLNWNLRQRIKNMKPLRKARFYLGAAIAGLGELKEGLTQDLDPRDYNCGLALGFNGVFGKGHGISDQRAVMGGLMLAVRYAGADINVKIRKDLKQYKE